MSSCVQATLCKVQVRHVQLPLQTWHGGSTSFSHLMMNKRVNAWASALYVNVAACCRLKQLSQSSAVKKLNLHLRSNIKHQSWSCRRQKFVFSVFAYPLNIIFKTQKSS